MQRRVERDPYPDVAGRLRYPSEQIMMAAKRSEWLRWPRTQLIVPGEPEFKVQLATRYNVNTEYSFNSVPQDDSKSPDVKVVYLYGKVSGLYVNQGESVTRLNLGRMATSKEVELGGNPAQVTQSYTRSEDGKGELVMVIVNVDRRPETLRHGRAEHRSRVWYIKDGQRFWSEELSQAGTYEDLFFWAPNEESPVAKLPESLEGEQNLLGVALRRDLPSYAREVNQALLVGKVTRFAYNATMYFDEIMSKGIEATQPLPAVG